MKLKEVLDALERFAPLPLQESWDNAGLQIGLTEADEVSGALLCLDVTEEVVDEAIRRGLNLVVSHHPLLFRGLKRISGATPVERAVVKAIRGGVGIISMHTNLDSALGGVNYRIAERLGLTDVHFFAKKTIDGVEAGSGVIGTLYNQLDASDFVAHVKNRMEAEVAMCNELLRRPVRKVAICGGAGDFLTGEMHYHQYQGYEQLLQIVAIGHYESEHFTAHLLRDQLRQAFPQLRTEIAETMRNPIIYL